LSELQTVSTTIGILAACVSVVIGVVNQIVSRQRTEKTEQLTLETRQAQLFMQIYNRWNTPDIQKAYGTWRYLLYPQIQDVTDYQEKVLNERAKGNLEPWLSGQLLGTYFEGLGMLVKKGLVDIDWVEDLFSNRIKFFWEAGAPIFEMRRQQLHDPKLYDSIEFLYNEMKKREQEQTNPST